MANSSIKIHEKTFVPYILDEKIKDRVSFIADQINKTALNQEQESVFVSILNGSFMFTSDLCKKLSFTPEISFMKIASYEGMNSSGEVSNMIGLNTNIKGKTVYIIEDIVDSGNTIEFLYNQFLEMQAKEIFVVCLLFKPKAYNKSIPIHFKGFEIPNDFVVGYGMDYNGLGRNFKDIYVLK